MAHSEAKDTLESGFEQRAVLHLELERPFVGARDEMRVADIESRNRFRGRGSGRGAVHSAACKYMPTS
jgi:hypothetical protein